MNFATISADIISYSSFPPNERIQIEEAIKELLDFLTEKFKNIDFYGRLVQGDYIECVIKEPSYSLRIALILKTYLKSLDQRIKLTKNKKTVLFFEHAIRIAVAIGNLDTFDPKKGIIDGEAIYMSGRKIKTLTTHNKQKVVIKNTMFFCNKNSQIEEQFDVIFSLIDFILSRCSSKQCLVIYYKLLNYNEIEISQILNKYQSTINQHSTSAGWLVIEKTLKYYESVIQ